MRSLGGDKVTEQATNESGFRININIELTIIHFSDFRLTDNEQPIHQAQKKPLPCFQESGSIFY